MLFGLACEGPTDQVTIENILCGYFQNPDLDQDITELQPPFDETDQKHGNGGWPILLKYLASARFRDDVLNTEFVILQIDSDIAQKIPVDHQDNEGNELSAGSLMANIRDKLIESIDNGELDFYQTYATKIIFSICVHSLECWLVAHHAEQTAIHNCFEVLKTAINSNDIRVAKKRKNYDILSQPFLDRKNIDAVAEKDPSFRAFIQSLETIQDQVSQQTSP